MVTVSSLDDVQAAVRERDARIAFLESELIETRLQLASAKTSEDRLMLQLNRMSQALAKDENRVPLTSEAFQVKEQISSDDVRILPASQTQTVAVTSSAPLVVPPESPPPPNEPLQVVDPTEGNTVRMPLGQHVRTHLFPSSFNADRRPVSYSRKRNVQSSTPSDEEWNNLNPGSCASGLDLLAGDAPARPGGGSSANNLALNSSSSINRMLGDIGLTASEVSLKKRRSGDVAGGHRRHNTLAGHYHGNEGWGDGIAARPQGNNMFSNPTRPQANVFAALAGLQEDGVAGGTRPQANLFAGVAGLQNSRLAGGNRPQGRIFSSATQTQSRANLFADLINSG